MGGINMKKYIKPVMDGQLFAANEYVGACTVLESGVGDTYYFVCDAGDGVRGGLYSEDWKTRISSDWNSYHACGDVHESPVDANIYVKGWFDPDRNHDNGNEIPVYIWLEQGTSCSIFGCTTGTVNKHATKNLNQDTWNKNFS